MKLATYILSFIFGFLSLAITAQDTIWFDANWNPATQEKAVYYRPAPAQKGTGFWVVDYYMNGAKQMEGFSTTAAYDEESFDGMVTFYYESGKVFQQIHYKSGKLEGMRTVYFKNGNVQNTRKYTNGLPDGKYEAYFETGELKETGTYKNGMRDGLWKTFYKTGKLASKGKYKKRRKVGVWKTYY